MVKNPLAPKKHKRNRHLDGRPTKAPSAYNLFVKEYFLLNKPPKGQAKIFIKAASEKWRTMTDHEKKRYGGMAARPKEMYDQRIGRWKSHRDALRRPTNAYGLYIRHIWNTERNSGRSVAEMGQYAASQWKEMSDAEKAPYRYIHQEQVTKYKNLMRTLDMGGRFDLNWRNVPLPQPQHQPQMHLGFGFAYH